MYLFLKARSIIQTRPLSSVVYLSFLLISLKNILYFSRQKTRPPSPSISKQRPPSPTPISKPAPIQRPPLIPGVINITKKKSEAESKPKEKSTEGMGQEQGASPALDRDAVAASTKTKEGECISVTETLIQEISSIY